MKYEQTEGFLNNSKKEKIKDKIMIEWANIDYKIKIKRTVWFYSRSKEPHTCKL